MLVAEFNLVISFIKYHIKSNFRDEKLQCPIWYMNVFYECNYYTTCTS